MAQEPAAPLTDWPPICLADRVELEIAAIHAMYDHLRSEMAALTQRVAELERSRQTED